MKCSMFYESEMLIRHTNWLLGIISLLVSFDGLIVPFCIEDLVIIEEFDEDLLITLLSLRI